MNEYDILDKLHNSDVLFLVQVPDRGRIIKVEATPFDLIEFAADAERFYAKCHRVTKETYLSWASDGFSVLCAHSEGGIQCRNIVAGGKSVTARKYVEMQGTKCSWHR